MFKPGSSIEPASRNKPRRRSNTAKSVYYREASGYETSSSSASESRQLNHYPVRKESMYPYRQESRQDMFVVSLKEPKETRQKPALKPKAKVSPVETFNLSYSPLQSISPLSPARYGNSPLSPPRHGNQSGRKTQDTKPTPPYKTINGADFPRKESRKEMLIINLKEEKKPENTNRVLEAAIRKIDYRILPLLVAGYFFNILDRNSISYARISNSNLNNTIDDSLRLTDFQSETCVGIYFITYVLLQVPSNIIMKMASPSKWLSLLWITWGLATAVQGLAIDFTSFFSCVLC